MRNCNRKLDIFNKEKLFPSLSKDPLLFDCYAARNVMHINDTTVK